MGSGWERPESKGGLGAVSVLLAGQRLSWLLERPILGGTMGIDREVGSKTEAGRYGEQRRVGVRCGDQGRAGVSLD